MKRVRNILLITLLFIVGIVSVKAEDIMPRLREVEAIVTNKDGLKPKMMGEVIPYDTKIKVSKLEDKVYYKNYEINESDIEVLENDFDSSKYDTLNNDLEVKVLKKDGIYLYKGPSLLYPTVGNKIEENQTLKCSSLSSNDVFMYCYRYKESGWLYTYNLKDVNVAYKEDGTLYTLKASYAIYDYPTKSQTKKVISQNKYSELNYSYYISTTNNSRWYYIDSLNGWILEENMSIVDDSSKQGVLNKLNSNAILILSSRGIPIYKNLDFKDRENKLIENKSVVKVDYVYYIANENLDGYTNYYYVDYDGVRGWIKESDADQILNAVSFGPYLHIGNATNTYKNYDLSSYAKGNTINYFDEVEGFEFEIYNGSTSSYMYYIKLNNEYVWLRENTNQYMLRKTDKVYSVSDNVYLYDKSESSSNIVGAIKKDTHFKEIYSYSHYSNEEYTYYWKYVEYLNTKGWIHVALKNGDEEENFTKILEAQEISDSEVDNINKEHNIYKILEEEVKEEIKQDYTLLILGITIVVVLLLIIVIIIVANKKRRKTVYTFN